MVLGASWGWSALSDADCFSCLTAFSQSPAHKSERSVGKLAGSWQEVNVVRGPYAFDLAAEVALCMSSVMGGLQMSSASAAAPHNRIRTAQPHPHLRWHRRCTERRRARRCAAAAGHTQTLGAPCLALHDVLRGCEKGESVSEW